MKGITMLYLAFVRLNGAKSDRLGASQYSVLLSGNRESIKSGRHELFNCITDELEFGRHNVKINRIKFSEVKGVSEEEEYAKVHMYSYYPTKIILKHRLRYEGKEYSLRPRYFLDEVNIKDLL